MSAQGKLKMDRKHVFRYMMKSFEVLMDAKITEETSGQVLVDLQKIPTRVLLQKPLREFVHDLREFYRLYYPGIMVRLASPYYTRVYAKGARAGTEACSCSCARTRTIQDKIVYVNGPSSPLLVKFLVPFPSESCTVHLCDGVCSGIEKLELTPSQRGRLREIISDVDGGLFIPMKKCKRPQESPINIRRWNSAAEKAEAIEAQAEAEWSSAESGNKIALQLPLFFLAPRVRRTQNNALPCLPSSRS